MSQGSVWLIILLIFGVIISNLMLLKYTSKFNWPRKKDSENQSSAAHRADDERD
ncbi:DUF2897 family protein [Idiomarina seosinensis]|uniref:DUF2897 family protein n=1 Tax=Idiomarina seosinensis TaxID=281739 RepID=UPI00384B4FA7